MQNTRHLRQSLLGQAVINMIILAIASLLLFTFVVTSAVEDPAIGNPPQFDNPQNIEREDQLRESMDDSLKLSSQKLQKARQH